MKSLSTALLATGLTAVALSVPAPAAQAAAPVQAADFTCSLSLKLTHIQLSASQLFKATSDCELVGTTGAERATDQVRGRYYKDRKWMVSSIGWTKVAKNQGFVNVVVGNTITGREIKGQAKSVVQQIGYVY